MQICVYYKQHFWLHIVIASYCYSLHLKPKLFAGMMRGREAGGLRGSRGMASPSSLFLLSETNLLRRTTKFLIEWPYPNPAINHHCQIYVKISFSVRVIFVGKLRHCLKERSQKNDIQDFMGIFPLHGSRDVPDMTKDPFF